LVKLGTYSIKIEAAREHGTHQLMTQELDFTKPQANKIQFILERWDKQWITSYDKNMRYSHLTPGSRPPGPKVVPQDQPMRHLRVVR